MTSYYFHRQNWSIDTTSPGVKLPVAAVFLIVPLMGAMFLMFMPLIGFVLAAYALSRKIGRLVKPAVQTSVAPMAIPGEAYLTGAPGNGGTNEDLKDIEREIHDRRNS